MRRMISQELAKYLASMKSGAVAKWVSQMKELISYDDVEEVPIFTNGFEVELTSIIDMNGNTIFASLENQAGKVVKVNSEESGFDYITPIEIPITASSLSGRTFESSYSKAIIENNMLYITLNGFLKNETENSISAGSIQFEVQIDDETASKIFDLNGVALDEENTDDAYQIVMTMPVSTGSDAQNLRSCILRRKANTKILTLSLYIENMSANDVQRLSGRTYLLLK